MDEDLIFKRYVEILALPDSRGRFPAKEWLEVLELRERRRADAGMENYDRAEEAGLRGTGRVEAVHGRRHELLELKLTRPTTPGPQLRFLGVVRGRTFWVAHAFVKKTRRIRARDIEAAERMLDRWQGAGAERSRT